MTAAVTVEAVQVARDGDWSFRDSGLSWRPPRRWSHVAAFDPFPCYPHDPEVTRETAAHVARCWPPLWDVAMYVCDREETSRSNAHSHLIDTGRHADGEWVKETPSGVVVLSGKRIMPHPAMTRHLVAHEYGHNAAWMLNWLRGQTRYPSDCTGLYADYAAVRGLPESSLHHGEGGTWHDSATEIFGCDFRLLVCGVEPEFWPHPGVPRPEGLPALHAWWDAAGKQVAAAITEAAGR